MQVQWWHQLYVLLIQGLFSLFLLINVWNVTWCPNCLFRSQCTKITARGTVSILQKIYHSFITLTKKEENHGLMVSYTLAISLYCIGRKFKTCVHRGYHDSGKCDQMRKGKSSSNEKICATISAQSVFISI